MYVSVLEWVLGGVLSVDGGWLPLPTRPQRYCDPASLVYLHEVQVIEFFFFWTINFVLLVTFERIKLEMPDWSHFKELFKIFLTVTNFL